MWSVSRQQAPYVFFRALGSCLSSVLQNYALQFVSASETLLVLENPFVPGIMAYLIVGEPITRKELLVYTVASVGLICMSTEH